MEDSQSNDSKYQDSQSLDFKRGKFINFLDGEINTLRTEIQSPGWTSWAICGAVAALIWLLLSEVHGASFNLRDVGGLILVISLFASFLVAFKACINSSVTVATYNGREKSTSILSQNRLVLILIAFVQIPLIFIITSFLNDVPILATIIAYTTVGQWLLSVIIVLGLSFIKLPMPMINEKDKSHRITGGILSVIIAIALWYYLDYFIFSPSSVNIVDIRIALVVAAIYILIIKLITEPVGNITLALLTRIRREFFLGRIDFDSAVRQTDIALTGLKVSQYFERYIDMALSLLNEAAMEYEKITVCLDDFEKLNWTAGVTSTENQRQETYSLIDSMRTSMKNIRDISKVKYPTAMKPLDWRFQIIEKVFKRPDVVRELRSQLNSAIANIEERNSKLGDRLDKILINLKTNMEVK